MKYRSNAYKVTVIFPEKYPDGNPIMESVWNAMTTELRKQEDGFTKTPASGEWRGERDDSRLYFFTVPTFERVKNLQRFVERWCGPFRQETMYFEYQPVHVEFLVACTSRSLLRSSLGFSESSIEGQSQIRGGGRQFVPSCVN